jgi:hypothetical protein
MCGSLIRFSMPVYPGAQWVLSLPHKYRFLIAKDTALLQKVVGIFVSVVFGLLIQVAKSQGIEGGRPGSVLALQRFGDGLVANTHMHGIFLQGVYHRPVADQPPVFVPLPPPTQEQVAMVAIKVKRRVEKLLLRKGKMPGEGADPEQQEQTLWDKLCAASLQGRIALGPKAGWRVRRIGDHPVLLPPGERYLCADADGFNVHAHTHVGAEHKEERERLCRYILRPALCGQRLSLLPSGDVIFTLKKTWSDGTRYLVFTPMELIEKLAVLVPPPHKHLVTYHGILSSAAQWRKEIVPGGQAPAPQAEQNEPPDGAQPELEALRPRRLLWAQLLQRTFGLDVLKCPKCGGQMKMVAAILDPVEIARLCENLGELAPRAQQCATAKEMKDEALWSRATGPGSKPPQAAWVKSSGRER